MFPFSLLLLQLLSASAEPPSHYAGLVVDTSTVPHSTISGATLQIVNCTSCEHDTKWGWICPRDGQDCNAAQKYCGGPSPAGGADDAGVVPNNTQRTGESGSYDWFCPPWMASPAFEVSAPHCKTRLITNNVIPGNGVPFNISLACSHLTEE